MPEQATLLQEKSVHFSLSFSRRIQKIIYLEIIRLRSYREPQTMSQAQIDLFEKERQDSTKTQVTNKYRVVFLYITVLYIIGSTG